MCCKNNNSVQSGRSTIGILVVVLYVLLVIILETTLGRLLLAHINNLKENFKDRDWLQVFTDIVLIISLITVMLLVLTLFFVL